MHKIYIWGYCANGVKACEYIRKTGKYIFGGFVDNSPYKFGKYVYDKKIKNYNDIVNISKNEDVLILIAVNKWQEIVFQCEQQKINILGVFENNEIVKHDIAKFDKLDLSRNIKLYAGDIVDEIHLNDRDLFGLSINKSDDKHIFHNIMNKFPLPDNSIYRFEAEDVFEYIPENMITESLNEIYRILKVGSVCRITIPDYNSDYLKRRTMVDEEGNFLFDPCGGGNYTENGICGGSINFFKQSEFEKIINKTRFRKIEWLCYRDNDGVLHREEVKIENGFSKRIMNENDNTVYSMLVDLYK